MIWCINTDHACGDTLKSKPTMNDGHGGHQGCSFPAWNQLCLFNSCLYLQPNSMFIAEVCLVSSWLSCQLVLVTACRGRLIALLGHGLEAHASAAADGRPGQESSPC